MNPCIGLAPRFISRRWGRRRNCGPVFRKAHTPWCSAAITPKYTWLRIQRWYSWPGTVIGQQLHLRDGKFFIDGSEEISLSKLQSLLADRPLDFSPNVLLRPLVQDTLLPTLAYVAGPSELAYLGQAQSLYKALGRPQPVVFPRAAFTLLDSRTDRLMEKYKLSLEDVWQGDEHLSQKIAASGFAEGWSERFDQGERELQRLLDQPASRYRKTRSHLARHSPTHQREDEIPNGAAARQVDPGRVGPVGFACPPRAGAFAIPPPPQGFAGTACGRGVFPRSGRLRVA